MADKLSWSILSLFAEEGGLWIQDAAGRLWTSARPSALLEVWVQS